MLKVGKVDRGHGPRHPQEDGEGTAPETEKTQEAEDTRGRDHLHVQPGEGGSQQRRRRRPRRPRCPQEQAEAPGEAQSGGHLGVEVEGVERHRGPDRGRPGPERRPLVPRQAEREAPHLEGQGGAQQRHRHHAGRAPPPRVEGRQQHGKTHAVRGVGPAVASRAAVVGRDGPRRVFPPVSAGHALLQVEVVVPPQTLGHEQVVRFVPGGAEAGGVGEAGEDEETGRDREEPGGPGPQPRSSSLHPGREGHGQGQDDEDGAQGPVEDAQAGHARDEGGNAGEGDEAGSPGQGGGGSGPGPGRLRAHPRILPRARLTPPD
jgi:hypothetical protein